MSKEIKPDRRPLLRDAAMTFAATQFGTFDSADRQSDETNPANAPPISPGGPLKQIDAGLLNVGCAEAGPTNGPAVILLQGWPYDIHSYVDVALSSHRQATG
ncbi:MAG: hypothetical protein ACREBW_04445 [Candidatus Micrarchaeaceae archaeon]